jgi:SAM-dependent methyltransferase
MPITRVRVDADGVRARSRDEAVLDVSFDGRRIWSFWLHRDGRRAGLDHLVPWPETLEEFLDGVVEVTVQEHGAQEELLREEIRLGTSDARIRVVNGRGRPIALDKYFRRVESFEGRSDDAVEPLLASIREVIEVVAECGIEAFLAYGTLLGAVRDGKLIGHDSDADLGYVSRHEEPADVVIESFGLQRALEARGYQVVRYSGAAIKVDVVEPDGAVRGLDLFGGFMREGQLHLLGEIRTPFRPEWIFPLTEATLEGHPFPVPAEPERLLVATYGESWRVPDPAFHFETPTSTSRRLNGWFRGTRVGRPTWDRLYLSGDFGRRPNPTDLVRWILEREPDMGSFIDIGCGRGRDASHVAERGVPTLALEQSRFYVRHQKRAWEPGTGPDFRTFNMLENRHVAVAVVRGALLPGPRIIMARHLADATSAAGRAALWRTASTILGDGDGRLYLLFMCREGDDGYAEENQVAELEREVVEQELLATGARLVFVRERPASPARGATMLCRIVAEWPDLEER